MIYYTQIGDLSLTYFPLFIISFANLTSDEIKQSVSIQLISQLYFIRTHKYKLRAFRIIISLSSIQISHIIYRKEEFERSVRALFHDFLILIRKRPSALHKNYAHRCGRKARGSERVSSDNLYVYVWNYTARTHGTFVRAHSTSRHLDAKAKAELSNDPRLALALARAHTQHTGIINECISIRQFFHVAPGNARTAGGRAGYIARSIKMSQAWQLPHSRRRFDLKAFSQQRQKQRLSENPRPWSFEYQGRPPIGEEKFPKKILDIDF